MPYISTAPRTRNVPRRTPRPRIVTPKVAAALSGLGRLGDYCVIQANGARICYGGPGPGGTSPSTGTPPPNTLPYPDGSALTVAGQPAVYFVDNGQIRWVPNTQTLAALGIGAANLITVPRSVLELYPQGPPITDVGGGSDSGALQVPTAPAPQTVNTAAAQPVTAAPTYSGVLETGAVYDQTTGYYTNPDGTIYVPGTGATAYGNYVSTVPTVLPTTSAIDLTSPSTWPTWLWLALAAGGTWLLLFKRR